MITLGIDPGIGGGWAVLENRALRDFGRMPKLKVRSKTLIDADALHDSLLKFPYFDTAVIELVSGRPGQAGVFAFGHSTGSATAVAMIRSDTVEWVSPQVWKKHFGLSKDKRASLDAAKMKFGAWSGWNVLANDGIAEAALMALWYLDTKSKTV